MRSRSLSPLIARPLQTRKAEMDHFTVACTPRVVLRTSSTLSVHYHRNSHDGSGDQREIRDLEQIVHSLADLVLHVIEHVGIAPQGHGRIGVTKHFGDDV